MGDQFFAKEAISSRPERQMKRLSEDSSFITRPLHFAVIPELQYAICFQI